MNANTRCSTCDGRGQTRRAGRPVACPDCNGTGERQAELPVTGRRNLPPIDHETVMQVINKVAGL